MNSKKRRRETTKGWEICIQCKDGSSYWNQIKDIKEAYPVQIAEYAAMHDIADEPAFAWWIRHTLKKRDHIISKTVSRYWQRTRKYSIDIPKSVDYGIRIDRKNKNIFWWDVIQLEMLNVRPAVEIHEEEKSDTPIGYTNRIPRDSLPYNLRCEAGGGGSEEKQDWLEADIKQRHPLVSPIPQWPPVTLYV